MAPPMSRKDANGVHDRFSPGSFSRAAGPSLHTDVVGWGARIRTWEWRNQNSSAHFDLTTLFLPTGEQSVACRLNTLPAVSQLTPRWRSATAGRDLLHTPTTMKGLGEVVIRTEAISMELVRLRRIRPRADPRKPPLTAPIVSPISPPAFGTSMRPLAQHSKTASGTPSQRANC